MSLLLKIRLEIKKLFGFELSIKDKYIFNYLNKYDIVIDCGANIGDVTELLAKNGTTVYAFEPNPYAFEVLNNRFDKRDNVICEMKAVGIRDDEAELFFHENSTQDELIWSTGSSLLSCKTNIDKNKSVKTEVIDLANFIKRIDGNIKLIKIDIEGMECELLDHLIDEGVLSDIDLVLVETHENKIPELIEPTFRLKNKIKKHRLNNIYLNWT